MPWQPHPKMHCHDERRNVTSTCQVRPRSTGSSNATHSRAGPVARLPLPLLVPFGCPLAIATSVSDDRHSLVHIDDVSALLADLQSALGRESARAEPLE